MIEALAEVFNSSVNVLDQLTFGLGRSILMIFPITLGLSTIFKIVKNLCQGERFIEIPDRSEPIRADPSKVNLKKETLDNDLKKYFDYDVKE